MHLIREKNEHQILHVDTSKHLSVADSFNFQGLTNQYLKKKSNESPILSLLFALYIVNTFPLSNP